LRAVVTDKRGQPVPDLKKEDFEVLENGKLQEISFLSIVKIPGRGVSGRSESPVTKAAPTTAEGTAKGAEIPARSVALFVDTLHLSPQSLLSVKQSMRKFIDERLTDQDLTAIVTSAGSLGVVEQFTHDRRVLRRAVDRLGARPNARDSLFTPYIAAMVDRGDREALQVAIEIYSTEEHIPRNDPTIAQQVQGKARQIMSETGYTRRASLLTIKEVVQRLSDLPGQRLLVMVSDGFTLLDGGGSDTTDLQSVTSRAARSGVVIYSIDAKGLQPPMMFNASIGGMPSDPRISSFISAGERDLENGLNALARDTGGEAFFNTNDTTGAMGRALDDNQVYYAIAYYPTSEESEKKFRKITIKIKNHPEYVVRAQRGYLPADSLKKTKEEEARTPQQRFVNAILAPLPMTAIPLTATASFAELPGDNAQVTLKIHIDGKSLSYHEVNGRFQCEAEIVTMIFNSEGKRVDLKSEILRMNLTPPRLEVAKENGFQYVRRIPLKPGLYQARVGIREISKNQSGGQTEERMGTSAAWVETMDLSKKNKMALSDLFLSDAIAAQITPPTSTNGKDSAPSASKVVNGIRYYRKTQTLIYYFWLYNSETEKVDQKGAGPEIQPEIQIEILKEEKPFVTLPWQPAKTRELGRDAKGVALGGQLEIGDIAPGIYELRISVKTARMKRPIQRVTPFGVEP
jgi:VWFA-related protein